MIVLGDLQELWNIDIADHHLLAVRNGNQISSAVGLRNYRELELPPDALYFNAGLLVINLQKWREDNIGMNGLRFPEENRATAQEHDQDALNAILVGKWKEIDPRWNQLSQLHIIPVEAGFFGDPDLHRAALDDPQIIHYSGQKPWRLGCQHPEVVRFEQYLDQTAWAGKRDTPWNALVRKFKTAVRSKLSLWR